VEGEKGSGLRCVLEEDGGRMDPLFSLEGRVDVKSLLGVVQYWCVGKEEMEEGRAMIMTMTIGIFLRNGGGGGWDWG